MSLSKAEAIVAAAGPLMNFLLAIVFEIVLCLIIKFAPGVNVIGGVIYSSGQAIGLTLNNIQSTRAINIGLGVFNLIPLPPLDGSKILCGFLPYNAKNWMDSHSQIFEIVFIALWIVGILSLIVEPIILIINNGLTNLFLQMFGII